MRRIIRNYVSAALERQRADLECFIAERLECSDAFPLDLARPKACICETQHLKIMPQARTDYPPVLVTVSLCVLIAATTRRRETAHGVRTAAIPKPTGTTNVERGCRAARRRSTGGKRL